MIGTFARSWIEAICHTANAGPADRECGNVRRSAVEERVQGLQGKNPCCGGMYRAMGFPEIQVELMELMGYDNRFVVGWMTLIAVPSLAYMIYLKKFFHRPL